MNPQQFPCDRPQFGGLLLQAIPRPSKDALLFGLDANNLIGNPGWADSVAGQPLFGNQRPFLYGNGCVEISEQLRPEQPDSRVFLRTLEGVMQKSDSNMVNAFPGERYPCKS